jgi:hypothetical protein
MESCAWELDQLIRELQGLPQALFSSHVVVVVRPEDDAVQHRRTLRRLDRALQQYDSLLKNLPEQEEDTTVDATSIPRKLVFLFARLSIPIPMPHADDAPSRVEEMTLSILQRIQSLLFSSPAEEAWEWFSESDIQIMLQQLLYHPWGVATCVPQPWNPASIRPVVWEATAIWLPALIAYFEKQRAAGSVRKDILLVHLTDVLQVATSMIQYQSSNPEDAPEESTAIPNQIFQWHRLTQSMLQYVLVRISAHEAMENAAGLGAALASYLAELTEYTLDLLDATTLLLSSNENVAPGLDCFRYIGLTSELWVSTLSPCYRLDEDAPVLPASLQPIFQQQFFHFWKALATAFMTTSANPPMSLSQLCYQQLQCTELWLSVPCPEAAHPYESATLLLLVFLRALPWPHLLIQSRRLWEYLRRTPRATTRLLQAALWTFTRQHWGILQPQYSGANPEEEEASPHRIVVDRIQAILESCVAPVEDQKPNAWDRFFWKKIRSV